MGIHRAWTPGATDAVINTTAPYSNTPRAGRSHSRGFPGKPCRDMQIDSSPRNHPSHRRESRDTIPNQGQRDSPAANEGRSLRRTSLRTIPKRFQAYHAAPMGLPVVDPLVEVCLRRWRRTSSGVRSASDRFPMGMRWSTQPDRHAPIPPRKAGDTPCRH